MEGRKIRGIWGNKSRGRMHLLLVSVTLNLVLLSGLLYERGRRAFSEEKEQVLPGFCPATEVKKMGSLEVESRISSGRGWTEEGRVQKLSSDSVIINLDHGDPTMFESFWRKTGEKSTIIIPGWEKMSYFSDVRNICWFLEPEFAEEVKELHKLVGNAETEGRHIIVGTGSTQLYQAALFALSPSDAPEPMNVVSATPYYSSYPSVTDFLKSGLYKWAGDAYTFDRDGPYIELVTSPNNPDGFARQPVVNREGGKTIYDLAYYWPQYASITAPADHDLMLFTVSKSTGHAGTRIGWALVKDPEVARRMTKYVELNTIGVSKDSQLRAAKILRAVRGGYEGEQESGDGETLKFFDFGRLLMAERWDRLRDAVRKNPIFSLPEFPTAYCNFAGESGTSHPAFAWLKCEAEHVDDCESFLRSNRILTRSGRQFGGDSRYVRVSMVDRDETFDVLIDRLNIIR
ncbi:tryptophan aminotransferase-related protein 2-like [Magnolia sinica]|uniref:tryptophan aminotransferase-related protein 2-like n=1 Tax=Magnolia sinica TaxID=86752 RepID=UPI002658607B|nr:tryptophan aminotransferase-related protein 2-like [Magnolia sinica]